MGKAEVGTPKYLANKMKAKGLQKLRWYCQMCEKQCRDENGFKCHTQSESHQRQLLLFADNSGKYIHSFSKDFADGYMELLRRRFGTKRVASNKVYQEYIADKNHLHMNATRWLTLSDFVKWLGRTGQCVVDETEKGWFVTYVDRSPEAMEAQEKLSRKEKMEKDDQERMMEFIGKQIEKAKKDDSDKSDEKIYTELQRGENEERVKLEIKLPTQPSTSKLDSVFVKPMSLPRSIASKRSLEERSTEKSTLASKKLKSAATSKTTSALDEIMKQEESSKERENRKDYWLSEGIVVKFIERKFGEKFYKQKAVVLEVIGKYGAKVKFLSTGEKMKVDQAHVETVLPAIGKSVKVLNGAYRGSVAIMKELHETEFCLTMEIAKGPLKGRIVKSVQYDDVSKLHES